MEKIKILFWFLQRPQLFPQLLYRIKENVLPTNTELNNTKIEATRWCDENAISQQQALKKITGGDEFKSFRNIYPNYYDFAQNAFKNTNIKMGWGADIDILYWLCEYAHVEKVIETGVAYGWSSMAILASMKNRENAKLISIDMPYYLKNNEAFVGCAVPKELQDKWEIIKLSDRQALPKAIKGLGEIDLCHYDSDKSYNGRMFSYPKLWNALRAGGVFISDDIGDNITFKHFCYEVDVEPVIVKRDSKFVGVLVKP